MLSLANQLEGQGTKEGVLEHRASLSAPGFVLQGSISTVTYEFPRFNLRPNCSGEVSRVLCFFFFSSRKRTKNILCGLNRNGRHTQWVISINTTIDTSQFTRAFFVGSHVGEAHSCSYG